MIKIIGMFSDPDCEQYYYEKLFPYIIQMPNLQRVEVEKLSYPSHTNLMYSKKDNSGFCFKTELYFPDAKSLEEAFKTEAGITMIKNLREQYAGKDVLEVFVSETTVYNRIDIIDEYNKLMIRKNLLD